MLLSGVLMFEHLGWQQAADDIVEAMEATISDKIVTYDFARQMEGATEVKTSEFASAIVDRLSLGTRVSSRAGTAAPPPSPGPPLREAERRKLPAKGQHGA